MFQIRLLYLPPFMIFKFRVFVDVMKSYLNITLLSLRVGIRDFFACHRYQL